LFLFALRICAGAGYFSNTARAAFEKDIREYILEV